MDNTIPKLRKFTVSQRNDILRRTFSGEPYAFTELWNDSATFRAELEALHRNLPQEKVVAQLKRMALATYYFDFKPGTFEYTYDNINLFAKHANGGKEVDLNDDYKRIQEVFAGAPKTNKEQPGFWGATGTALQQDMLQLSGTVYNFLAAIAKGTATAASVQARAEAARVAPGAEKLLRTPDEAGKMASEAVRKVYTNRLEGAKDTEQYLAQQTGVPENWVMNSGSVSNWFRNFGVSFIGSLPSTVANLGMSALGGPAAIGTVYAADGYYRALDEGMSEQEALGYGSLIGIINGVGETVTNKLLLGKGAADISKDALIKDLARNWFIRFARAGAISGQKEGWQEAAEQTAENIADIAFMRRGDYEKMDAKTLFKEVFRNVPEAYVQAVAVGFGLEAGNFKSKQSFNEMKLQEYRNIDAIQTTIAELENRSEELTQDERDLLQTLTVLNDAGNPAMIAKGAEMAAVYKLRNELDKKRLQTAPDTETAPEAAENGTEDFSPEETAAFDNAGQTLKLRHFLPHDPQDTVNAVYDTMTKLGYTSEVEVMTTGWNDEQLNIIKAQLSPEISAMLQNAPADAAQSILSKFYPAFYHNGTVYINALSVRPSEVSRVLAHEAGLHYGMRQAFKGDIDKMLDWVYSENFDTPELARIIEKYTLAETELDEDGSPIYDGDGNAVFKELSETNRRIAAEELLADLAETGGYDYRKIYADNRSDIDAFAKDNNYDVTKLSSDDRKKLVKSWIDETGFTPAKPNWFKRLISNVRIWFHNHGIKIKHLSEDDIANIILRSAKAARDERRSSVVKDNLTTGEGARFLANALKNESDLDIKQAFPENASEDAEKRLLELAGEPIKNRETGDDAQINNPQRKKLLSNKAIDKSIANGFTEEDHRLAVANVKSLYENAVLLATDPDLKNNDPAVFIKRYAAPMVLASKDNLIADVLITQKISSDKGTSRIYSLEVDEIVPEIKIQSEMRPDFGSQSAGQSLAHRNYPADVIHKLQQKHDKIKSFLDKFVQNTDRNGQKRTGTDKSDYSDVSDKSDGNALFSLESSGSEELKLQVMAMRPLVGNWLDKDGAEYARRFKEKYGISIDPDEAKVIAALAISENKSAHQKQVAADNSYRAWEYFKSYNPLFDFITEFAGDNFKINPGKEFAGDEFTGTFITPEYRKYSVKRRQEPNESDAKYRQYLAKREKALAKVSGTPLDEVAQAYARESGRELKDVQEEIIDLLRNLQRTDIISQYKKYKDEQIAADKSELEALRRAAEDDKRRRIEEEVTTVIQSKSAIDADFAKQNPKVYTALQEALFPGQTPAPNVSKTRLQEINAAVESAKGDASGFIEGFRAGRDAAFKDYSKKLKDFREKMRSADADRIAIAREADTLLRQLLPKEEYSKFARRVIALRDITAPKARLAAFDALRKDIVAYADIVKRDQTLEYFTRRLQQLGRRSDTGRKAIGVRDEATQRQIDKIREYAALSRDEAASKIENLQNKLEAANADTFQDEVYLKLLLTFGALDSKTLPELLDAAEQLEELARIGRENFNAALAERAANDEALRQQVIAAIKTGKAPSNKLERLSNKNKQAAQSKLQHSLKLGIWDNLNLWGMFDLMNKTDSDVFAKLARDTHSAARNEDTINFRNADDLNRELNSLLGTNSALDRAEKILEWRKVVKNSGVFRYSHSDNATKRFKYTYYRISDAKYLLEEYDRNPAGSVLQDYQAEAVRHQIDNFDNKVRKKFFSSFSDGVTEKLEELAANEEIKRSYDGMDDGESLVCVPTPDFSQAVYGQMEFSQMQALSLWLYARQPTMAYKLHFNGFDNKTLEQLDAFLSPELKKLGLWMVNQLELDRTKIGEVYEKLYFTSFPTEQNYFPAVFEHIKGVGGKEGVDLTQQGAGNAPMAYSPGALKQRVFHLGEPQIADALTIFQNHRLMMNHFVTHGESVRQLRAIFNNKELQTAIIDQYGEKAYRALADQLEAFVKGGNVNAQANAIYQAIYGSWVRSKMAANITSGIKQTFGFITYGQEIPASALAKGSAYALRHPGEALEILKQSDYFNNRLRGGANAELRWLLDSSGQAAGKKQAISRKVDEYLSAVLRFGDAASVLLGGYATYKYHLDNLVDRGVDKAEAHKQALLEMEMATERTQQSSKPHMLTAAQRSPLRAFTSFKSNQILLMNKLLPAIINRDGKQIRASLGALIVSSVVMTAVGDLLRKGLDFDEYEWTDYIENVGADFLSGYGYLGAIGTELISSATSTLKGSFRFRGNDPLFDLTNMTIGSLKVSEHMENGDADRIFGDVQKILTGAGLLTDTFSNNFFVSSAAAIVRESRKWWNILSGNNKGGRRRSKRKF